MKRHQLSIRQDLKFRVFSAYPFLFAAFIVLFYYSQNITKVQFSKVPVPFLVVQVGVALVFCGHFWILRKGRKAALATTVFLVLFFSYAFLLNWLELLLLGFTDHIGNGLAVAVAGVAVTIWITVLVVLHKRDRDPIITTKALSACAAMLVVFNLLNIVIYHAADGIASYRSRKDASLERSPRLSETLSKHLPDIYYVIFDEYAGIEAVREVYGYDNTAFVDFLRDRGFFVATQSRTLYPLTQWSLASTLNMREVEKSENPYGLVRDNRFVELLKEMNYTIVQIPAHDELTFDGADVVMWFDGHGKEEVLVGLSDFSLFLLKNSALRPLHHWLISNGDFGEHHRRTVLGAFDQLKAARITEGPKLVFVHIMCPHFPFVFETDGGSVAQENYHNIRESEHYLGQYEFITLKAMKMVEQIQAAQGGSAVIIIQSDHGQRGFAPTNGSFTLDVGDSWQNILNAFYFPGSRYEHMTTSQSPAATLRELLDSYLPQTIQNFDSGPPAPYPQLRSEDSP